MENKKIKEFWYESNECWGNVQNFQELTNILTKINGPNIVDNLSDFLKGKQSVHNELNFGTRIEHSNDYTLDEFLKDNGVFDEFVKFFKEFGHDNK